MHLELTKVSNFQMIANDDGPAVTTGIGDAIRIAMRKTTKDSGDTPGHPIRLDIRARPNQPRIGDAPSQMIFPP